MNASLSRTLVKAHPKPLVLLLLGCAVLGGGLLAPVVMAEPVALASASVSASAPAMDPPGRAGRVAELQGEAWLFDAETKEWVQLSRNQTVADGDRIRTDERSRLTVRIGSTSLWLDERADVQILKLNDDRLRLQVDRGSMALRVRSEAVARELEVQTREGRFGFEREGLYRIDQLDRGSRAQVMQGRLRFESRGSDVPPVWLSAQEEAEFWWANGPRVERQRIFKDAFGDWLQAELRQDGDRAAYRYVSPEMTGAEDLDRHGRWEQSDNDGPVWIPHQVAADWAPYRHGRWVWARHWGWTWVDDAPWGFAPFHYGRWTHWRGRWCWVPGRYVPRPVYAPALVVWVGGPHVSVGIGRRPHVPHHGWFPLAPREHYLPSHRHSPGYIHRVNPDPVTVVNPGGTVTRPVYRNQHVSGAISVLPSPGNSTGLPQSRPTPWVPSTTGAEVPLRVQGQAPARQDLPVQAITAPAPAMNPAVPLRDREADRMGRSQRDSVQEPSREPMSTTPLRRTTMPPSAPSVQPSATPPASPAVAVPGLSAGPAPSPVPMPGHATGASSVPQAESTAPLRESRDAWREPSRNSGRDAGREMSRDGERHAEPDAQVPRREPTIGGSPTERTWERRHDIRAEPRTESRPEPRFEPRPEPRMEPRMEPRPEPRMDRPTRAPEVRERSNDVPVRPAQSAPPARQEERKARQDDNVPRRQPGRQIE